MQPVSLKCELQTAPLGVDVSPPRLSWQFVSTVQGQRQTAYRLLVASSPEVLLADQGDLWDSGKVVSDASVWVPYAGAPLSSRQRCFWKVRVWDKDDVHGPWSATSQWSVGLLDAGDWQAAWIGAPEADTAPLFRQSFTIDKAPDRAVIYLAAMGYYELHVNGARVGDEVLAPAVSNFSARTYYRVYDLTAYLVPGRNHVGIRTGQGWYKPGLPGVTHHSPLVRAQLEVSGAVEPVLATGPLWQTAASERSLVGTWHWNDFGGERVDARLLDPEWWHPDRSTHEWRPVVAVEVPTVPCTAQYCAGNVTLPDIQAQALEALPDGGFVVDFGTNLTGMLQATFRDLDPGQQVTMHYADLDVRQDPGLSEAIFCCQGFQTFGQYDEYIAAPGGDHVFTNRFNYHGFRYVLLEGLAHPPAMTDLLATPIETEVAEVGSFRCSNELYNRIHEMVRWTYRCLNLGGQTVDCPHRERVGYGDGQTIMDTGCFNFDTATLYTKWSRNWWDEERPDGSLPYVAPCPHGSGGGPAWSAMCIMVPWKTYLFHGDRRLLAEGYPTMKRFLAFLESHCQDGLLQDLYPDDKWLNLGDWVPPGRGMEAENWVDGTSRLLFNDCYRLLLLQIMRKIAGILELADDANDLSTVIAHTQTRIHQAYFDPATSTYANGQQPYLVFPLLTGVTPDALKPAVFANFLKELLETDGGHLNTGMIGTQLMTDYLIAEGRHDLIDTYVNRRTYPGWGYMIEQGATTCWEQWNGFASRIHSCFPYIGGWFYRGLAGIQWDVDRPGFKHIILRPNLVKSVDWVDCHYDSIYGRISSSWKREGDRVSLAIQIPTNTTATLYLPTSDTAGIREGGKPLDNLDNAVLALESGRYTFTFTPEEHFHHG